VRIVWSLPVRGARLGSSRGDLVRARHLIEALRSNGHQVIPVEDATHAATRTAVTTCRSWLRRLPRCRPVLALRDLGRCAHGCLHGIRIAGVARASKADLIVETQVAYTISGAIGSWAADIPLVLDDCSPSSEERAFGTGLPSLARAALALQGRSARRVVAVSPSLVDLLVADGVPRQKIVCVPNGIDIDAFGRLAADHRPPELAGRCVVCFVGSFQPWHRVDLLAEALAALPGRSPIHVVLAGEGPGLETALRTAAQLGVRERITYLGAVRPEAVPALLASCDIGVMPHSNAYGDPMKLRDYAGAGLPAVAPDLAPIRTVVEHESTGLLFPPGDVAALARALTRLAADPAERRRQGDRARRRAREGWSWQERGRELLAAAALEPSPTSLTNLPVRCSETGQPAPGR